VDQTAGYLISIKPRRRYFAPRGRGRGSDPLVPIKSLKYDFMHEKYETNEKQSCGAGAGSNSEAVT
jgi:hypothetical protein